MLINLPATEYGITKLYDAVAKTLNIKPENVKNYDCKRINVSTNVADAIQNWYEHEFKSELGDDWKMKFGMEWVCFGPKTDEKLPNNTIEIFDDFITT